MKKLLYNSFLATVSCVLIAVACFAAPQNTSSTTAQTIIDRSRYLLNETTPEFWSDTELLRWVNDGIWDIAQKTLSYQTTEEISLVADTYEYTPTTSYFSVVAVLFTDSSSKVWPLKRGNVQSVNIGVEGRLSDDLNPKYWYEFNGEVGVYPIPASVTNETITVYFAAQPTDITLSGTVPTPAIFDSLLVDYVVAKGYLKDSRLNLFNSYWEKYSGELDRYRIEFVEQPKRPDVPVD